ncbi:MAG: hypothetical protein Rsou_0372 [Candidatus Ruthia sp. Asou_11_S2]|nr:hypothetical protein [Candidatus Ruthia sp. Asou_11_S2]
MSEKLRGVHLVCHDFLFWNPGKYDLIIGNPPYETFAQPNQKTPIW